MQDVQAMPELLSSFLSQESGQKVSVTSYETMTGGYSRLMARAEVRWQDGSTETLVLRGDPPPGYIYIYKI